MHWRERADIAHDVRSNVYVSRSEKARKKSRKKYKKYYKKWKKGWKRNYDRFRLKGKGSKKFNSELWMHMLSMVEKARNASLGFGWGGADVGYGGAVGPVGPAAAYAMHNPFGGGGGITYVNYGGGGPFAPAGHWGQGNADGRRGNPRHGGGYHNPRVYVGVHNNEVDAELVEPVTGDAVGPVHEDDEAGMDWPVHEAASQMAFDAQLAMLGGSSNGSQADSQAMLDVVTTPIPEPVPLPASVGAGSASGPVDIHTTRPFRPGGALQDKSVSEPDGRTDAEVDEDGNYSEATRLHPDRYYWSEEQLTRVAGRVAREMAAAYDSRRGGTGAVGSDADVAHRVRVEELNAAAENQVRLQQAAIGFFQDGLKLGGSAQYVSDRNALTGPSGVPGGVGESVQPALRAAVTSSNGSVVVPVRGGAVVPRSTVAVSVSEIRHNEKKRKEKDWNAVEYIPSSQAKIDTPPGDEDE